MNEEEVLKIKAGLHLTHALATLRNVGPEACDECLVKSIAGLGYSVEFVEASMDIDIQNGRAFTINLFGSDPEVAVLRLFLKGTKDRVHAKDVTPEELKDIDASIREFFRRFRAGEVKPGRDPGENQVEDFAVVTNKQVH